MFDKILIANRGEIAVRIIRACRELGIRTVAVYSEIDKDSLHVHLADEAVCIGPNEVIGSYLNMQSILSAAIITGAEAIHPGFGFLSENAKFVQMCEEVNITFIGPKAETIDLMGNKNNARQKMKEAGVPIVPGTDGYVSDLADLEEAAEKIGYPMMVKAAAGGGGKGMRVVQDQTELSKQFQAAKNEAYNAFGDDRMYAEKMISPAKHIEIQILADQDGNVIHLGERDCSLQKGHQKMVEEAPASQLSQDLRDQMGADSVAAAKAVDYRGAGTIEYIMDQEGNYYFMEMNTRIQVEHPITEEITGVDIVKEQIAIAAGKPLSLSQDEVTFSGHAIECRINAQMPHYNFAPSPGRVDQFLQPAGGLGLRVDSAIYPGAQISQYYDSMIAKVITHGKTREEAVSKMRRALSEMIIEGVETNIDFQYSLMADPGFLDGNYTIDYLEDHFIPKWLEEERS